MKKESFVLAMLCLLIGLGAGQNFRYVTNYRYSWEKQRQLFWQLKWRAPALEPGTAIIGDGALVSYMGSWVTTSSFLQMYAPGGNVNSYDYWYFEASDLNVDDLVKDGTTLIDSRKYMRFESLAKNSLVIDFEPEKLQCLRVLSPHDQGSRTLPKPLLDLVSISNLDRIQVESTLPLRADIFGPEISHDWCYYFQKGDLESQARQWGEVVRLWREAEQNGKYPRSGAEYRPFIKGFAHTGDWQTAVDVTRKAAYPKYEMRALLCDAWKEVAMTTQNTEERNQVLFGVMDEFECQDELKDLLPDL